MVMTFILKPDLSTRRRYFASSENIHIKQEFTLFNYPSMPYDVVIFEGSMKGKIHITNTSDVKCRVTTWPSSNTTIKPLENYSYISEGYGKFNITCRIGSWLPEKHFLLSDEKQSELDNELRKEREQLIKKQKIFVAYDIEPRFIHKVDYNNGRILSLENEQKRLNELSQALESLNITSDIEKEILTFGDYIDKNTFTIQSKSKLNRFKTLKKSDSLIIHYSRGSYKRSTLAGFKKVTYGPSGMFGGSPKNSFLEPSLVDGVLVCGIAGKNELSPLNRILYIGSKHSDKEIAIRDKKGNFVCRVNGKEKSYSKNNGQLKMGYTFIDGEFKTALNEAIKDNHNEITMEQEGFENFKSSKQLAHYNNVKNTILSYKERNDYHVTHQPQFFCEQRVPSKFYSYDMNFVKQSDRHSFWRRTGFAKFCNSPMELDNGKIAFLCSLEKDSPNLTLMIFSSGGKLLNSQLVKNIENGTQTAQVLDNQVVLTTLDGKIEVYSDKAEGLVQFDTQRNHEYFLNSAIFNDYYVTVSQESKKNYLYIMDKDGRLVKDIEIKDGDFTNFAQDDNGLYFISRYSGNLYTLNNDLELSKTEDLLEVSAHPRNRNSSKYTDRNAAETLAISKRVLYFTNRFGEVITHNLVTQENSVFFQVPNEPKTKHRSSFSPAIILDNGDIVVATELRVFHVSPQGKMKFFYHLNGELKKDDGEENYFIGGFSSLYAPMKKVYRGEEEMIWFAAGGSLQLRRIDGSLFLHYDTPMAENFSSPYFLDDNRIISGTYLGVKLFDLAKMKSYDVPVDIKRECNE
jgi:hypothetical protein